MYVIRSSRTGLYVAVSGYKNSYTNKLSFIRVFKTIEEAQANLCPGNESILSAYSLNLI